MFLDIWKKERGINRVHGCNGESGLSFRFIPQATAEHDVPETGKAY